MAAHPQEKMSHIFFDTWSELKIDSLIDFVVASSDMGTTTSTTANAPFYYASQLIGQTKEYTRLFILSNIVYYDGTTTQVLRIRVTRRNGVSVPIIEDYDPNRLNVFIDRHRITQIQSMG